MQCQTQVSNITTNMKVKIYLTSPAFITTHIVPWDGHMDEFTKCRYNMILDIYILT